MYFERGDVDQEGLACWAMPLDSRSWQQRLVTPARFQPFHTVQVLRRPSYSAAASTPQTQLHTETKPRSARLLSAVLWSKLADTWRPLCPNSGGCSNSEWLRNAPSHAVALKRSIARVYARARLRPKTWCLSAWAVSAPWSGAPPPAGYELPC